MTDNIVVHDLILIPSSELVESTLNKYSTDYFAIIKVLYLNYIMSVKNVKKTNSIVFITAVILLIILGSYIGWLVSTGRLSGSADTTTTQWLKTTITGQIVNTKGENIAGANIMINSQVGGYQAASGQSNTDGNFSITFGHPPMYQYNIAVNKAGYIPYIRKNIVFSTSTYRMGKVVLQSIDQAKGVIKGTVKHKDGTAVTDAWVIITSPRGDDRSDISDNAGNYEVDKLGIGLFYVKADPDTFTAGDEQVKTVTLGLGEIKTVNFTFP